ncbi:hypothetical protein AAMO2058_001409500 [Amorphochlora amoebiformis]|uniref:Ion transport domain-containing protein n=1 Tax=Amorphochlora amoebiformis TaxID=1561963 RepID=A0A7S0H1F0_9EUKA|mmetsp:Transcript_26298/g.41585  ORF Transcript_26298/g.41585 Transcript_26298/m.41585 type:complete len:437 (+) Transcript_26298:156-1466(+)|eukprot:1330005-Amorphochlora_amoeboformis.AAC.1
MDTKDASHAAETPRRQATGESMLTEIDLDLSQPPVTANGLGPLGVDGEGRNVAVDGVGPGGEAIDIPRSTPSTSGRTVVGVTATVTAMGDSNRKNRKEAEAGRREKIEVKNKELDLEGGEVRQSSVSRIYRYNQNFRAAFGLGGTESSMSLVRAGSGSGSGTRTGTGGQGGVQGSFDRDSSSESCMYYQSKRYKCRGMSLSSRVSGGGSGGSQPRPKRKAYRLSKSSNNLENIYIQDQVKAVNLRAQRTIGCYLTYVMMIWIAIVVILWEISSLHRRPNHWLHIMMEGVISIFLLGEIVVFTVAMGTSYFKKWIHVADLVITVGCALVFVGLLVDEMVESFEWPEEFELSILLIRYGLMACRLLCLFYRSGRAESVRKLGDVRFSRIVENPTPQSSLLSSARLSIRSRSEGNPPGWLVSVPDAKSRRYEPLNRSLQ